nr:phosphatidylinositol-specific phospholipase C domain-containing protein [Comamonas koreensis]
MPVALLSSLLFSGIASAASRATYLYINNFSNKNILKLETSAIDNSDWDGDSRPDKNINGKSIPSGKKISERQEINTFNNTHCFDLKIIMENESPDGIRVCMDSDWTNEKWRTLYTGSKYDVIAYGQADDVYINVINHVDLKNWTSNLPDNMNIALMSVPGTHDSATWKYDDLILNRFVKTQRTGSDFNAQLNEGIRFFDIRVKPEADKKWSLYHGSHYLGISFDEFLDDVNKWLSKHPSETIFVSIKEDEKNENKDVPTNDAIFKEYRKNYKDSIEWLLEAEASTTLGDARGKLILMNRFSDIKGINLNSSSWLDNGADINFTSGDFMIRAQDAYQAGGNDKSDAILKFMADYSNPRNTDLKFNFMSSSTSSCGYFPEDCADSFMPQVNFAINQKSEKSSSGLDNIKFFPNGIISMDFYDVELSRLIAAMNQLPKVTGNFRDFRVNDNLPAGVYGAVYSQQLASVGGAGEIAFSGKDIPNGIDITGSGVVSASATLPAGVHILNITATDSTKSKTILTPVTVKIVKAAQTIAFTTENPLSVRVGDTYTAEVTGGQSTQPITVTVDPASTNVCSLAGKVVTFNATGSCTITAKQMGDTNYLDAVPATQTLKVIQAASVASISSTPNPSTPDQVVEFTVSVGLDTTKRVAPQAKTAPVPTGTVSISDNGTVLGSAPLANGVAVVNTQRLTMVGSHSIVASYSGDVNYDATQSAAFAQTVVAALTLTAPASAPGAKLGEVYSLQLQASSGSGTYTYALASGSGALPAGLTLSASTGLVSGMPSAAGDFPVTFQVTDGTSQSAQLAVTITVAFADVRIPAENATLPDAVVGIPYNASIVATGGAGGYGFTVTQGQLPAGLSLNADTGAITGTPTSLEAKNFSVTVVDSTLKSAHVKAADTTVHSVTQAFSITVIQAATSPTPVPTISTLGLVLLNSMTALMLGLGLRWRRRAAL